MAALRLAARGVAAEYGSLGECLAAGHRRTDETVLPALCYFSSTLRAAGARGSLLPDPCNGSACKRLCLYTRWMLRKDAVDPGGYRGVPASRLIVPLDTHMFRVACSLGFTERRQPDMRTALEVTAAFRRLAPRDPLRYDFVLTRPGIWRRPALLPLPGAPVGQEVG